MTTDELSSAFRHVPINAGSQMRPSRSCVGWTVTTRQPGTISSEATSITRRITPVMLSHHSALGSTGVDRDTKYRPIRRSPRHTARTQVAEGRRDTRQGHAAENQDHWMHCLHDAPPASGGSQTVCTRRPCMSRLSVRTLRAALLALFAATMPIAAAAQMTSGGLVGT